MVANLQGLDKSKVRPCGRTFLGHPIGLFILSVNEIWERFSYYGMKALLIFFLVAQKSNGGMEMPYTEAAAVFGLYSCLAGTMILPGGWIADNICGQRMSLLIGGVFIMLGHMMLALLGDVFFYPGLLVIVLGTGLLKPSSTIMVSQLYEPGDPKQVSGYTVYYMCINIGAFLGPLVCGILAQRGSWHLGFGAGAVGMFFGILIYVFGFRYLGNVGLSSSIPKATVTYRNNVRKLFAGSASMLAGIAFLVLMNGIGWVQLSFLGITKILAFFLVLLPILYFTALFKFGTWTRVERNNLIVIAALFFVSVFFWSASDQRGSLMMFFADEVTRCSIGSWSFPSAWFAAVNPALIILFTFFFAWLWPALGKRNPSVPGKFLLALLFTIISFVVMIVAAMISGPERERVDPQWLIMFMVFITIAEMCLSPVGISAFASLAPKKIESQIMGVWFLKGSLSGLLAGAAGSAYKEISLVQNFSITTVTIGIVALILFGLLPKLRLMMNESSLEPVDGDQKRTCS